MGTVVSPPVRLKDGARLYSVLHPAAKAIPGRRPVTVVLLHGWTLDNRLWRQQIADLPARLGAPFGCSPSTCAATADPRPPAVPTPPSSSSATTSPR
ncbi:hypothetical protein [Dactylosporangium darangshiense]|uniref:hypothetical protein n=1 Tax=Dactylosporangium darangshiense TaxID=579108 RepID=UPI003645DDFE